MSGSSRTTTTYEVDWSGADGSRGNTQRDRRHAVPLFQNEAYELVARYRYDDAQGRHLFSTEKYRHVVTGEKEMSTARAHGGPRRPRERGVLFRLPQLRAAIADGRTVYVCEGEADVLAVENAGGVATTNPWGAGAWERSYTRELEGADVVLVADDDPAGWLRVEELKHELAPVVRSLRVVKPATGEGTDVSDHLAAGYALHELVEVSA